MSSFFRDDYCFDLTNIRTRRLRNYIPRSLSSSNARKDTVMINSVTLSDFVFLRPINKGAYGQVWQVMKKNTKDIYALKIIDCAEQSSDKHLEMLRNEKEILSLIQGDYVVNSYFTFIHENFMCFCMEYLPNGDLANLLDEYGRLEEH